jgi:hypothetical protein
MQPVPADKYLDHTTRVRVTVCPGETLLPHMEMP